MWELNGVLYFEDGRPSLCRFPSVIRKSVFGLVPFVEDDDALAAEPAGYLIYASFTGSRTGYQRPVRAERNAVAKVDLAIGRKIVYQLYGRCQTQPCKFVRNRFDEIRLNRKPNGSPSPLKPVVKDYSGKGCRFSSSGSISDAYAGPRAVRESLFMSLPRVNDPLKLHSREFPGFGQLSRKMRAIADRRRFYIRKPRRFDYHAGMCCSTDNESRCVRDYLRSIIRLRRLDRQGGRRRCS